MKNKKNSDKPIERVKDAKMSEHAKALALMNTSYENTWPVGETASREEILEERRQKELARQKYAPHLNKPDNTERSEFSKAISAMSTSYENTFPVGEAISREQILEGRREKAILRKENAHLLEPTD